MSAPLITVFLPIEESHSALLQKICKDMVLSIDVLPPDFPFTFSAQRIGGEYFLIEYDVDAGDIISELMQWEKISEEYRLLLCGCKSCINIHYRNLQTAKDCALVIANYLGQSIRSSVLENGHGCLVRLSDVIAHCTRDSNWTWERDSFPEIPGVSDSEWIV